MVQEQQPQPNKIIKLGIWGTSGAGKTVYMLMLYHYLQNSDKKDRFLVMLDEETDEFLNNGRNLIIDKGEFPPSTSKKGDYSLYSYMLQRVNSNTIVKLTFFDLPGEVLKNRKEKLTTKNSSDNINSNMNVAEYLTECDGILILLSPLKEDYEALGCSYFTLLDGFFRLMQIKSQKFKLEQYVVFGITKADHDEIYQRTIENNFYQLFMEIIGTQAQLSWLKNLFYLETEEKNGITQVNINGENNRCCFLPISPFARYEKDGKMISPVALVLNENKTEDESKVNESEQEQPKAGDRQQKQREDPFGKNSSKKQNNSAGDYETPGTANNSEESQKESQSSSNNDYETPSTANNDQANQKKHWEGKYKIDKNAEWKALNVIEPIEWLIKRIENHRQQHSNNS